MAFEYDVVTTELLGQITPEATRSDGSSYRYDKDVIVFAAAFRIAGLTRAVRLHLSPSAFVKSNLFIRSLNQKSNPERIQTSTDAGLLAIVSGAIETMYRPVNSVVIVHLRPPVLGERFLTASSRNFSPRPQET